MDKIKYENETILKEDELIDLLSLNTLPLSKMIWYMIMMIVLQVILIMFWDNANPGLYIALTVMIAIGLIGTILLLVFKKKLLKASNKSLKDGVVYKYIFYENEFVLDTKIGDKTNHQVLKYEGLEKIVIKDDYAFLYVNNVSIYFVNLNNFAIIGSVETPFATSITNLTPVLFDSSLMATIPSILPSSHNLSIEITSSSFETL